MLGTYSESFISLTCILVALILTRESQQWKSPGNYSGSVSDRP